MSEGPYRGEWDESMSIGRVAFESLRDDANAAWARKDKPVVAQTGRVGQQKQKRKSK